MPPVASRSPSRGFMPPGSPQVPLSGRGGGGAGSRAGSRCASPAAAQRSPSVGCMDGISIGFYRKGDLIEYNSTSHKEWLPATVVNTDSEGRITIDLKPATWISREEQATKVRPRRRSGIEPPSSRGASPLIMRRSPSYNSRAGTPSRAASPRVRAASYDPPLCRAESPFRAAAGIGTPRLPHAHLPPGLPAGPKDSPLRRGGASILGVQASY